jgi:hypothetical protein
MARSASGEGRPATHPARPPALTGRANSANGWARGSACRPDAGSRKVIVACDEAY